MAEWVYEDGIGEARAALIDKGAIVEAAIEVEGAGLRVGTIIDARLVDILVPRRRGIATSDDGVELFVAPLLAHWTQGQRVRVDVRREAIGENIRTKRAMAVPAEGAELRAGPSLRERLFVADEIELRVTDARSIADDVLEPSGWIELLESAQTGLVAFAGGSLQITATPAMTLIDVDGWHAPEPLAVAAAEAAGLAIRRLGIGGSVGIDFPTVEGRAARAAVAHSLDAVLPQPFERTALNGFGFLQVVRPRLRASLIEHVRDDPVGHAARTLVRRVQRERRVGAVRLVGAPGVIDCLAAHPDWLERLAREQGGAVTLRTDEGCAIDAGYAEAG